MAIRKINYAQCDNKGIPVYHDGIDCDQLDNGGDTPLKDSIWLNAVAYQVDNLKTFIENSNCFEEVKNDQGNTVGYKVKEGKGIEVVIEVYDDNQENIADRPMPIGKWAPLPTKDGNPPPFDPFDPTPKVRNGDYKPQRPQKLPLFNPDHAESDRSKTFIPVLPDFDNRFPCDIPGGFQDDSGMYWEIFNSVYYYMNTEYEKNIYRVDRGETKSIEIILSFRCDERVNNAAPDLPRLGDFPSLEDVQNSMQKPGDN